jgi:hypothetical protein
MMMAAVLLASVGGVIVGRLWAERLAPAPVSLVGREEGLVAAIHEQSREVEKAMTRYDETMARCREVMAARLAQKPAPAGDDAIPDPGVVARSLEISVEEARLRGRLPRPLASKAAAR